MNNIVPHGLRMSSKTKKTVTTFMTTATRVEKLNCRKNANYFQSEERPLDRRMETWHLQCWNMVATFNDNHLTWSPFSQVLLKVK